MALKKNKKKAKTKLNYLNILIDAYQSVKWPKYLLSDVNWLVAYWQEGGKNLASFDYFVISLIFMTITKANSSFILIIKDFILNIHFLGHSLNVSLNLRFKGNNRNKENNHNCHVFVHKF